MNKGNRKFKFSSNLFWIIPLLSVILYFLCGVAFEGILTVEVIENALNFNMALVVPLFCFLLLTVWLLACLYCKSADKGKSAKDNLSYSVIAAIIFLSLTFLLSFVELRADILFIFFLAFLSEIISITYYTYRIVAFSAAETDR